MPVEPIDPVSDPRVEHKTATLNGQTYHYLYAVPKSGEFEKTVFLVSNLVGTCLSRIMYMHDDGGYKYDGQGE
jgi:hypothetical protein